MLDQLFFLLILIPPCIGGLVKKGSRVNFNFKYVRDRTGSDGSVTHDENEAEIVFGAAPVRRHTWVDHSASAGQILLSAEDFSNISESTADVTQSILPKKIDALILRLSRTTPCEVATILCQLSLMTPFEVGILLFVGLVVVYVLLIIVIWIRERSLYGLQSMSVEGSDQEPEPLLKAWNYFDNNPSFFKTLDIAKDGGLTDVKWLFTKSRFIFALILMIMICVNVFYLVVPNLSILTGKTWVTQTISTPLVCNALLYNALAIRINEEVLLALLEFTIVFVFIGRALRCLCIIAFHAWQGDARTRHRKWNCAATLFMLIVPETASVSGLKMLGLVAPAVFVPHLTGKIHECKEKSTWHRLPLWLFAHLLAGVVGIDAFMIKFVQTADIVRRTEISEFEVILTTLVFLNQMLGVVDVGLFSKDRVLLFIFGGEDCYMNEEELLKLETWHAMLALKMWEFSRNYTFATSWFMVVALSYTDVDFQRLTLNGQGAANFLQVAAEPAAPPPAAEEPPADG